LQPGALVAPGLTDLDRPILILGHHREQAVRIAELGRLNHAGQLKRLALVSPGPAVMGVPACCKQGAPHQRHRCAGHNKATSHKHRHLPLLKVSQNSISQNLIMSLLVSVVFAETCGAFMNVKTAEYSAEGSTAEMPSTGKITFMPRNAAPLPV